jgi:GTP-binding protein
MFLDTAKIKIQAGNGGSGVISFIRNKLTMNGGPDGGNGGKGGDIYFVAKNNLNTLYSFKFKTKFEAEDGEDGGKQNSSGKEGKDLYIEVPCGTIIKDARTGKILADLIEENKPIKILRGGKGGRGNAFYATPTRQSPHFSQTGEKTKIYEVILELKTIADVGLVGYPNVGKSTLLSAITNARPKIANYHFTTLTPNLGVVSHHGNNFVIADIPGLIEGASEGVGLGYKFLKHIERVRLIVHMVDISEIEGRDAFDDYIKINRELKNYSEILAKLPQIIALTKIDLLTEEECRLKMEKFKKQLIEYEKLKNESREEKESGENGSNKSKDAPTQNKKTGKKELGSKFTVLEISSVTHKGLEELKNKIWEKLKDIPKPAPQDIEYFELDQRDNDSLEIIKEEEGIYRLAGGLIDSIVRGVILSDMASFAYFQRRLKQDGILDKLRAEGAVDGDTIRIKDVEFILTD